MRIAFRIIATFGATVALPGALSAQPATAPAPHFALDELVKEYKRLGLPLPPANAQLMRLKWNPDDPPTLGFLLPTTKPSGGPQYLIGTKTYPWYPPGERVENDADAPKAVEPQWVSELLCTAAQCRVLGLTQAANAIYARGLEAIEKPMPSRWVTGLNRNGLLAGQPYKYRAEVWRLNIEDDSRSAELELRHAAFAYWHGKIMMPGADRREVLRYLQAAGFGSHRDVRDLERTVAPRKSKPGTAEALIDDLTEYQSRGRSFGEPLLSDPLPGETAYWKLAEMGFDAIPALLDHVHDSRFTRQATSEGNYFTGDQWRLNMPTHVGQLARYLVNHFAGEVVIGVYPDDRDTKAREWWEKARKVGEEKWLLSLALPDKRHDPSEDLFSVRCSAPDRVILRVLRVKYTDRLAEVYRSVLRERPEIDTWELAPEIAASKLPRAEQLSLLTEGAEHKRLVHRTAALRVLAKLEPSLFRKQLLATLKRLPPDVTMRVWGVRRAQVEFTGLLWETNDPACWEALVTAASWSPVDLRIEMIRAFDWYDPDLEKSIRRQLLRFLLGFLSDDSVTEAGGENHPAECMRDIATEVLARQLGVKLDYSLGNGPFPRLLFRAVVAKSAAEELARLKQ